jgi:penicillin-binding protein 2
VRKLRQKSELEKSNFRYNILTTCAYFVGIIIIIQLFNLQIINGAEYRETSNTRLSRKGTIEAARGSITDRTGTVLVSTDLGFSVEMYKTNVDDETLNNSILLMTNILKQNGDTYINPFPICINPFGFMFDSEEELASWRTKYKIPDTASAEEAFYIFRDKYNIQSDDPEEILQILAIRYAITTEGYSTTKTLQISSSISAESAVQLQEMGQSLTGVSVVQEPVRKYHTGTLASHIIGYMQRMTDRNLTYFKERGDTHEYEVDDKVGQTGIEYVFEEYLRGEDGVKQIEMSVDGTITGEYTSQEAIGGANIVLTIDANLQEVTEKALAANIEKIRNGGFSQTFEAEGGSAVVMNVNTGEILAMASYPDYNPEYFYNGISQEIYNSYTENKNLHFRATSSAYAPGSTFKMITAVAALESGVTTTTEKINDSGPYYFDGVESLSKPPACWYYNQYGRGHGWLNVVGAIEKSCNYFFYEVASRMGIDTLEKYARFYGIGSKTGVELSSEVSGTVASKENLKATSGESWTQGHTINAAIGQGINNVTPLQMARYISMIANGGKKIQATIVKDVILSNGTHVSRSEIEEFVKEKLNLQDDTSEDFEISESTTKAVLQGMLSVTDDAGGTAYSTFQDFNIQVGGKTGSAEAGKKTHAWFVGFAPFDNPEIAVVVMVENGGHGSYTAEVVRDIIAEYFGMNVQEIKENMSVTSETESFR